MIINFVTDPTYIDENKCLTSGTTSVLIPDATGSQQLITVLTGGGGVATVSLNSGASQIIKLNVLGILVLAASIASVSLAGASITFFDAAPGQWMIVASYGAWV